MADPRTQYFVTLIALLLPNIALCFTEPMSAAAITANILLPGGLYALLMTLSRHPGRMIWGLFPLIFFAAFQLVLLYLFGHSVIAVDMFLNVVTTNTGEVFELLDNLIPAVAGVFVIYLPILITAGITAVHGRTLPVSLITRARRYGTGTVLAGIVALGTAYATERDYSAKISLYPLNVCYNLTLAVERTVATNRYPETSARFTFHARSNHPADSTEVYVLVIGETARAADFALYGYPLPTTPLTAATPGLVAFDNVTTQSNTTHKSVPMLLSAATADDYDRIYREKSLITAFREAGYYTTFLSNQMPNRSFIDIFGREADRCVFLRETTEEGRALSDMQLVEMTRRALAAPRRKQLIVLHTYGSHFNYRERYPRSAARFTPDDATEAVAANRPSLINAYDNTIVATDRLLHTLTSLLAQHGTAALIYTSDHGENIFDDDRRLFLHASPIPSYYELHVPLMVWTSDAYKEQFAENVNTLERHRHAAAENSVTIFHTLLYMAGIDTPLRNDTLALSSRHYRHIRRHYLSDHNRPVPLSRLVTDSRDLEQFSRHRVSMP